MCFVKSFQMRIYFHSYCNILSEYFYFFIYMYDLSVLLQIFTWKDVFQGHIFLFIYLLDLSGLSILFLYHVQFSSVAQLCPTLCDPMNRSTPGLPVHHQLPEFTQTHVHRVGDAIQPSHPLLSPSPPAPNPSHVSYTYNINKF